MTRSLLVAVLLLASCGGSGDPACGGPVVTGFSIVENGPTSTCGPEAVDETVEVTTEGTVATVTYHTIVMICGGTVGHEMLVSGDRVTIEETVSGGGECGCFTHVTATVEIDLCTSGTWTVVVDEREQSVTI